MKIYIDCDLYAIQAFKWCHNRVRDGKVESIEWTRTRDGYLAFCNEIGPKPREMKKPSVGRIDHNKGYCSGNIQREEHRMNSVKRHGTKFEHETAKEVSLFVPKFKKGTK